MKYNYEKWPNFDPEKLKCSHSGKENPNIEDFTRLMNAFQELRDWYGKPMTEASFYRHPTHPIEARKGTPGQHSIAAGDFRVPSADCHMIVEQMFKLGFRGIGINLTGSHGSRFIHGDFRKGQKALWSY